MWMTWALGAVLAALPSTDDAMLHGRCIAPDGRPLADVHVHQLLHESVVFDLDDSADWERGEHLPLLPVTTTSDNGHFELPLWSPPEGAEWGHDLPVRLLVMGKGVAAQVVDVDNTADALTLTLPPSHLLIGRAESLTGDGVAGVEISVEIEWFDDEVTAEDDYEELDCVVRTTTGRDGTFALDGLGPGSVHVKLDRRFGRSLFLEDVALEGRGPTDLGALLFHDIPLVSGHVVDTDGQPIEGATVVAFDEYARTDVEFFLAYPPDVWTPLQLTRDARTDANGRFAFEGLDLHERTLAVYAPGHEAQLDGDDEHTFTLAPYRHRLVRVSDASGAPLAHATVRAVLDDDDFEDYALPIEPAGEGTWSVPMPTGRDVTIEIAADEHGTRRIAWSANDKDDATFQVALDVEGVITGHVSLSDGTPHVGAELVCYHDGVSREVTTDASGRYEVRALAAGAWRIRPPWRTQRPLEPFDVAAGEERVVDLVAPETAGTLSGRVVMHDGSPLAKARVELVLEDASNRRPRPRHTTSTDADGRFAFTSAFVGEYRVRCPLLAHLSPVMSLGSDDRALETFVPHPALSFVRGRLIHNGKPTQGTVMWRSMNETGHLRKQSVDHDGTFLLSRFSDNRQGILLVLHATRQSTSRRATPSATDMIVVPPGEVIEIELALE